MILHRVKNFRYDWVLEAENPSYDKSLIQDFLLHNVKVNNRSIQ